MIVLVSDTSVLIDLERAGLLETAFSCGITMVVPDLLYHRELEKHNGPYLCALGLGVVALTATELSDAQVIKLDRPSLSLPDCFALACATRSNHCLVSGDGIMRKEAEKRTVTVHGLIWLLDQMMESGVSQHSLASGLTNLLNHPRCRLPRDAVELRLSRWKSSE